MNQSEIQKALLNALEQLQHEHAAQLKLWQGEQEMQQRVLSARLDALTDRLDSLTEQLNSGTQQTLKTSQQVQELAQQVQNLVPVLNSLSSRLIKL